MAVALSLSDSVGGPPGASMALSETASLMLTTSCTVWPVSANTACEVVIEATFERQIDPDPNGALSALAKSTATLRWSVITAPPELTTLISRFGVCWPEETV